jgi:hypothetical protein
MKCNKTQRKWCINKHEASKIIDAFETYHTSGCIDLQGMDTAGTSSSQATPNSSPEKIDFLSLLSTQGKYGRAVGKLYFLLSINPQNSINIV